MLVSMLSATQSDQECCLKVLVIRRDEYSRIRLLISSPSTKERKSIGDPENLESGVHPTHIPPVGQRNSFRQLKE